MIKILRKILMVQDETIRCPYWEQGKCTAVDNENSTNSQAFGANAPSGYPLNCNYQAEFIRCSKYLEVRVKEIEARDRTTQLGEVIPKDMLRMSIQSQEEAKRIATGGRR